MEENKDYMGATEDLLEIVKDEFNGKNEVLFTITPEGFQRIEITDLDTNETWQTIEGTELPEDEHNFDEISVAMIVMLNNVMGDSTDSYAQLN